MFRDLALTVPQFLRGLLKNDGFRYRYKLYTSFIKSSTSLDFVSFYIYFLLLDHCSLYVNAWVIHTFHLVIRHWLSHSNLPSVYTSLTESSTSSICLYFIDWVIDTFHPFIRHSLSPWHLPSSVYASLIESLILSICLNVIDWNNDTFHLFTSHWLSHWHLLTNWSPSRYKYIYIYTFFLPRPVSHEAPSGVKNLNSPFAISFLTTVLRLSVWYLLGSFHFIFLISFMQKWRSDKKNE